jgi:hypothetical protein
MFAPHAAAIAYERILRIQGYSDVTRVRPAIVAAAKAMAQEATRLSLPRIAYTQLPIAALDGAELLLPQGLRFECPAFGVTLAGCTNVALFVLSLGERIDARVIEFSEHGDLLEALLLETAGWLSIEDATRQFKLKLRTDVSADGLRITSRMGPGYSYRVRGASCGWSLHEQAALFNAFGDVELPAALNASKAMTPKMSRSGLFGIAPSLPPVTASSEIDRVAVSA